MRLRFPASVLLAVTLAGLRPFAHPAVLDDGAFYCAARVLARGGDPSRVEPLRTCETSLPGVRGGTDGFVVPAPLPLPALAALEPLAALPFPVAHDVWIVFLVLAGLASLAALERLAALPRELVQAIAFVPLWVVPLTLGQPSMIAVAALGWAALAARAGRNRAAGLLALAAAVQPQLAAGALGSLVLGRPRARAVVAIGLAAGLGIWLALAGPARALAYVACDLPAQARAELGAYTQYAPTFALAALGVPAATALALGAVMTVAGLVGGIWLGRRLAARTGDGAFLVAMPPACALIGSSYVHAHQLAAALPAALLVAGRATGRPLRRLAPALLLAFPLMPAVRHPQVFAPFFMLATGLLAARLGAPVRAAICWAFVPYVFLIAVSHIPSAGLADAGPHPVPLGAGAPAIASWASYVAWSDPVPNPWTLLFKLPTWLGLGLVIRDALAVATRGADADAERAGLARFRSCVGSFAGERVG